DSRRRGGSSGSARRRSRRSRARPPAAPPTAPSTRRAGRTARARTTRRSARRAPRSSRRAGTPGPFALAEKLRKSRREQDRPNPGRVLARPPAQIEAVLRLGPMSGDDAHQLVPVRLGVVPALGLLVLAQLRV